MIVKAKPLGWDGSLDGPTKYDDEIDPYDGPKDEIEGELEKVEIESDQVPKYVQYIVNGIPVDPKTIKESGSEEKGS